MRVALRHFFDMKHELMTGRLLGAAVVCLLAASALALTEAEARAGGVERAEGDAVSFFADPRIRHLGHETVETRCPSAQCAAPGSVYQEHSAKSLNISDF